MVWGADGETETLITSAGLEPPPHPLKMIPEATIKSTSRSRESLRGLAWFILIGLV
jgi:hypothetical protein